MGLPFFITERDKTMSNNLTGQVTAYLGGPSVAAVSMQVQAAPHTETIPLMAVPVPSIGLTVGDLVALGGFAIVCARFWIDTKRGNA